MSTTDEAVNDWELGSGLDLDGAKVEVTKCEFGFNNDIGAGVVCANFTFTPIEGGDDIEQSFSVGKGWESDRTGENLVSDNGKPRKLNMNSNYGVLLNSAIDLFGTKEQAAETLGSPRHAPNWIGTMWKMGTKVRVTRNPTTGAEKESTGFIFTEFLGDSPDAGAEEPAKPAATKATGARKAAGSKAKAGVPEGIDDDLWQALVDLAVEVQDAEENNEHDDFMERALEIDGVDGNKAANKAIMTTRAGSVWAAATKAPREG